MNLRNRTVNAPVPQQQQKTKKKTKTKTKAKAKAKTTARATPRANAKTGATMRPNVNATTRANTRANARANTAAAATAPPPGGGDQQRYINNIEANVLIDPVNIIPPHVMQQLKMMKKAAQENVLLHLENSTLNLYEYALKKMMRKYFPLTDMHDLITEHRGIVDTLRANKLDYKVSRFKILFSGINHYLRFFEKSDDKIEAIKNYRTLL